MGGEGGGKFGGGLGSGETPHHIRLANKTALSSSLHKSCTIYLYASTAQDISDIFFIHVFVLLLSQIFLVSFFNLFFE